MTRKEQKLCKLFKEILDCQKCALFKTRVNALPGEGPADARVMLVAQAPGEMEDMKGRMFIGPSGQVLDSLLENSGVLREQIYMTNLIKCILPQYRKPKKEEIDTCSYYLNKEIEILDPPTILGLGYYASRYLLESFGINYPQSRKEFRSIFGKLFLAGKRRILPIHHPAALLHSESLNDIIREEYAKIATLMSDCIWYSMCPMKWFTDRGLLDEKWVQFYCLGDWRDCKRFELEERMIPHPDNMLPDGSVDESLRF